MSKKQKQSTSIHSLSTPASRIRSALNEGYVKPPVIPGVKIVDFISQSPQTLKEHEDLLDHDPRVSALHPHHVKDLAHDIKRRGLTDPLVVISPPKGGPGSYSSLNHHRLEALLQLNVTTVFCWVAELIPYNDSTGRRHTYEEILEDFTGAGVNSLNEDQPPRLPMCMLDRIRHLSKKHRFGAFGEDSLTGAKLKDDELRKAAREFAEATWASMPSNIIGKIVCGFMDNVNPKKYQHHDANSARRFLNRKKSEFGWDIEDNILSALAHNGSVDKSTGIWLKNMKRTLDRLVKAGKPQKEAEDLLKFLEIHLYTYILDPGSPKKLLEKRNEMLAEIADINNDQVLYGHFKVTKILFMPQILEPRNQKENKLVVFNWNNKTNSWV